MKTLFIRLCSSVITITLVSSCAQPIKIEDTTSVAIPEHYLAANTSSATPKNIQAWWLKWQDPQLNHLIQAALEHNYSIQAAEENYLSALSMYNIALSDLGPKIGVIGDLGRGKINSLTNTPALFQTLDLEKPQVRFRTLAIQASWAPDIFGQKQSDKDAAYHYALSIKEKVNAAQTIITAQLAQAYFEYQIRLTQKQLLNKSIERSQELLRYVRGRYQAGQAKITAQDAVSNQINELHQQSNLIDAQLTILKQLIATLSGQTAQDATKLLKAKIQLPAIPVGMQPSDLLYRRPDLRARKAWIDVKTAQLASAKLDLLPRFNISFLLNDGKIGINSAPDIGLTGSLLNFELQLPIFMSGRIKNNINRQQHELKAAIHEFDNNLLQALQEVESAYSLRHTWEQNIKQQAQIYQTAKRQVKNSHTLYQTGEISYQDLILAQLDEIQAHNQYLEVQLKAQQATVQLYQALGGGWLDNANLDTQ